MYHGKRIGVAMATYNGEKYIREQILSILQQTLVPDEILVSDDGSKDGTLDIVRELILPAKNVGTEIVIRTDNPRHGIGGNFEWAITHSVGDYIFICGQDDVWMPEKVEHILEVFSQHPDAEMVCHGLSMIDANGNAIEGEFSRSMFEILLPQRDIVTKAERAMFLDAALSTYLISGTSICMASSLVSKSMPIPVDSAEDQWLPFCATADNALWYLDEKLVSYRIHNSASHSVGMKILEKAKRRIARVKTATSDKVYLVRFSKAAMRYLSNVADGSPEFENAIRICNRIYEIGCKEVAASRSGRISGAYQLTKLFFTDMRYRRIGTASFLTHLANILCYSKARRRKDLGEFGANM